MTATLESHHDAFCKEIEKFRVEDETPSTVGPKHGGHAATRSWLPPRRHTYSVDGNTATVDTLPDRTPVAGRLYVPLKESLQPSPAPQPSPQPRTRRDRSATQSYGRYFSLDYGLHSDRGSDLTKSADSTDAGIKEEKDKVLMKGQLYKTSRLKNSKTRSHSRQHRHFRLTAHSLEYHHVLQKV